MQTLNRLAPHPRVAVEKRKRKRKISQLQRSTLRSEGPQPHTELSSLEHQCQEEEPPHLAVKNSGNSNRPGEIELRHLLKGPAHRLTCSQTVTLGSSRGSTAQEAQETYREKLSCVAPRKVLKRKLPLYLCWAYFGAVYGWVPSCLLNSLPVRSILKLHWLSEIGLLHPMSPLDPMPPNPQIAHRSPLPSSQPYPVPSLGHAAALSSRDQSTARTFWGRFVMGCWCQSKLQCFLGQ